MGLDLVVEGCAKPGHEAEWRRLLQRSFDGDEPEESDVARFQEITIPPHERVGAPRVGYDPEANRWIIQAQGAQTPDEIEATLRDFAGYYVLQLVKCDGIPEYSHGGLYEGVDNTSFRGAFLSACRDVLPTELIEEAWKHRFPDEAVAYGRALLAASDSARPGESPARGGGLGGLLGFGRSKARSSEFSFEEQQDMVRSAGKWFVFWGERNHAIRAWF